MTDFIIYAVGFLGLAFSVFLGIKFAKSGTPTKDLKFHCPRCGGENKYLEFAKQACPHCGRNTAPSKSEFRSLWWKKKINRFTVGFLGGLILMMFVLGFVAKWLG